MVGTTESGSIGAVREGMRVVDVDGDEVGTVREVRMSDGGVEVAEGDTGHGGLFAALGEALVGDDSVPEQEQRRLARLGYVRIDARGLFAGDRYAAADEIADVAGDEVRLTVPTTRLVG